MAAQQGNLARWLATMLPAMTLAEALKTTHLDRVAGLIGNLPALVTWHSSPPTLAPNEHPLLHTSAVSDAAKAANKQKTSAKERGV